MRSGRVDVHVDSSDTRDHFHLHVKNLDIEDAKLYRGRSKADPGARVDLMEAFEYEENEFFVMRASQHQDPGRYIMSIGELKKNKHRHQFFGFFLQYF